MNKITFLFTFLFLGYLNAQTTFNWDTEDVSMNNSNNGDPVTQTIKGVVLTFTGATNTGYGPFGNYGGSTDNVVSSSLAPPDEQINLSSVSFSFSEAADVLSIQAIDYNALYESEFNSNPTNVDFTFTPIGGSNSPITATLTNGYGNVALNWTDVTSFTVSRTDNVGTVFMFDNIVATNETLSANNFETENISVYPNPSKDFLYVENISNLKSVKIYNGLGQLVLDTNKSEINVSGLNKGLYILSISTDSGMVNKKIVKN